MEDIKWDESTWTIHTLHQFRWYWELNGSVFMARGSLTGVLCLWSLCCPGCRALLMQCTIRELPSAVFMALTQGTVLSGCSSSLEGASKVVCVTSLPLCVLGSQEQFWHGLGKALGEAPIWWVRPGLCLSMLIWSCSTYCCDSFSPSSIIIHVKCEMNWIYSSIKLK